MKKSPPPAARDYKKQSIHFVSLKNVSIFEQLQLEEALLRADTRNWCLVNTSCPKAIVLGISGKPEKLVDLELFRKNPVPLIKRFSGGGTVCIDPQTIFVTWICNVVDTNIDCCPQKIHQWSAQTYRQAFPKLNMSLLENDYVIENRKFGGNAQYLSKGRWLHHSSFLWDYESEFMRYLLHPPKTPLYRQKRTHQEFLCRLRDYIPQKHEVEEQLLSYLQEAFHVETVDQSHMAPIKNLPHRQTVDFISFPYNPVILNW